MAWVNIEDRLPDEINHFSKPHDKAWLIYDGSKIGMTTEHPKWWNYDGDEGNNNGPIVTHWMELPDSPQPTEGKE
jgi:hypothetical protein